MSDSRFDLRQSDALRELAAIAANSVDAIITDPPYCSGGSTEAARQGAKGQGLRSETLRDKERWFSGDAMTTGGLVWLLREVAVEAARCLKPSGSLLIFTDWRMAPAVIPAAESAGMRYRGLLVWDKGNFGLGLGFRPQHELILHLTNESPQFFDQSASNVLRAGRVTAQDREHPTQKPVDLLRQLVRVVSPPGGLVVDPFMGSGSTGVAAIVEGRRFFGVERDPQFVETARRRLSEAAELPTDSEQPSLFAEAVA